MLDDESDKELDNELDKEFDELAAAPDLTLAGRRI